MRSCNTIILDFGGVLMKHDREGSLRAMRALVREEKGLTEVIGLGNDQPGTLRARFERGEISKETFVELVLNLCKPGTIAQHLIEAWNTIHAGIHDSTWAQIQLLKDKGYKLYLLSNTDAIHWTHTMELYGAKLNECIERVYLSYEMGLCKPDKRVFETVDREVRAGREREDRQRCVWFVDDLDVNRIAAKKSVGWHTCASIDELLQMMP